MITEATTAASITSTGGNPFNGVAAGDVSWKEMSLRIFTKYQLLHNQHDGGLQPTPEIQDKRQSLVWSLCKIAKAAGLLMTPAEFMERLGINRSTYTFGMMHRKYFLRNLPEDNLMEMKSDRPIDHLLNDRKDAA